MRLFFRFFGVALELFDFGGTLAGLVLYLALIALGCT